MDQQSDIEIFRSLAIAVALCIGVLVLYRFTIARAEKVLRYWAAENHLELLHFKRRFLTGGFSPSATSRNQIVYFVRVRDQQYVERSGWVRCGIFSYPFGNRAEVKWKDLQ